MTENNITTGITNTPAGIQPTQSAAPATPNVGGRTFMPRGMNDRRSRPFSGGANRRNGGRGFGRPGDRPRTRPPMGSLIGGPVAEGAAPTNDRGGDRRGAGPKRSGQRRNPRGMHSQRRAGSPSMRTVTVPATETTMPLPPIGDNIRIYPLGGVEEIGRNMTAIEYKDEIIVIDAGLQFSNEDTPGVDYILPNTTYLEENKHKVKALVITHGHLDHVGGIPYIMPRIGNPPLYTREFGALLIKKRQAEFPDMPPLDIRIVERTDGSMPISENFKVRFFGVTHPIPDSTGIIVETPFGDIVNTGDVRVDNDNGVPSEKELEQYELFKNRKVLLLSMDSTGIEKSGWSLPESAVIKTIDAIIKDAPGRVIIATFASQVERVIEFIKIAKKYGRKVVIEGRSMKNNVEIIKHLNLVDIEHVISVEDIEKYAPHKILMLATGGQGEEFAALVRISNRSHKQVRLSKTDTVILSSSIIPGNDRAVEKLKDNLFRHDARIITYLDSDVHTSGHGKRGELEWIHSQIPYKFFMPVHGSHFRLKMHAELARNKGCAPENIVVPNNGSIVEIYDNGNAIRMLKEKVPSSGIMVDGFSIGNLQEVVLRDRQMLAEEGMFIIFAIVNAETGKLKKSPDIISRGFVYLRESQELLHEARLIVKKTIEDATQGLKPIDIDYTKDVITDNVSRFLFQKTAKRPIVIPVILSI